MLKPLCGESSCVVSLMGRGEMLSDEVTQRNLFILFFLINKCLVKVLSGATRVKI